ncbi:MAG: ABC transporter permease [Chloroflexi bacterium]|nr:ABC transporter permease [Chloroflexota bacterium]
MSAYLIRRVVLFMPVLLGVSMIIFVVMRVVPGDVAYAVLAGPGGEGVVTEEALATVRERLGLNKPYPQQYVDWVWGMLHLDFGRSLNTRTSVWAEIQQRLPITLELAVLTALTATLIAVPVGTFSAMHKDTLADYVFQVVTIVGLAAPTFWIGTLIIMGLVRYFNWIPPLGFASLFDDPWTNLQQIVWPAVGLGYHYSAVIVRMTRSSMLEVLRQDYVRTAWAKGLRQRVVIYHHALKNAMLPVVTIIGLQFAVLLGGAVIMETIFSVPGMGRALVEGIQLRDYTIVQGSIVVFALLILLMNLIVDLLYARIDPRVGYGKS